MATIIEGGVWKLSEEAAERMVENELIFRCSQSAEQHIHEEEIDDPVYHRHLNAPKWLGVATMTGAIRAAEAHVKEVNEDAERPVVS